MPALAIYQPQRNTEFLFELEDFFSSDLLDFTNTKYFPNQNAHAYAKYNYPKFVNPFMENEVKGFIRYVVMERKVTKATAGNYAKGFVSRWAPFINDHYPDAQSVVEFEYETIYGEFIKYLESCGLHERNEERLAQVNKDMEWVTFPVKSYAACGLSLYYKYINSIVYPDLREERVKDAWDVRNLNIPYHTLPSRPRYTVSFENIEQKWLRQVAKDYCFYRIQNYALSTVVDDLKAINLFSRFLKEKHPEIASLTELDRNAAKEFIAYVKGQGFVTTTSNGRLSSIKTFMALGNIMFEDDFPTVPLFFNSDFDKVVHKDPIPFTKHELRQMNAHVSELPVQVGRMLFVLENCGMRMSDLCSSPILVEGQHCIKQLKEDEFLFTYYMPKSHRTNTIPVAPIVAEVINSAIETSQSEHGSDCKYIFAKTNKTCISQDTFVRHMNNMSKRNDLKTDDGKPLRIKGHTFRRTVATEYANMGISMDLIRMMLGQRSIGVLKHYVTIHSATMIDAMKNIIDEDDRMIRNMGNVDTAVVEEATTEEMIPLPNGYCRKSVASGPCEHANACYTCRMHRASKEFLPVYEAQLREAEYNIEIAKINGYERFLQINETLAKNLRRIIQELTNEDR